jgi:hypothetical protein
MMPTTFRIEKGKGTGGEPLAILRDSDWLETDVSFNLPSLRTRVSNLGHLATPVDRSALENLEVAYKEWKEKANEGSQD